MCSHSKASFVKCKRNILEVKKKFAKKWQKDSEISLSIQETFAKLQDGGRNDFKGRSNHKDVK